MQGIQKTSTGIIGLALFSMFFGSGNLIYPLFVGQVSGDEMLTTALGFLCTAVLLPFLGVLAMVEYQGSYTKFFECLGGKLGFLLTLMLLTVWIPLGSGPRCMTLAYASISTFIPVPGVLVFGVIYSFFVLMVLYRESRMYQILGYVLTPALLTCLGFIILSGWWSGSYVEPTDLSPGEGFLLGLKEGYNTMDMIAAFFFSASTIHVLSRHEDQSSSLVRTFRACSLGMVLLAAVYLGMIFLAHFQAHLLIDVPKDRLLAHLAKALLGDTLGGVAALAITLACFTTSVALTVVYAEFLQTAVFGEKGGYHIAVMCTLGISLVMSIFGLEGITFITAPALQVMYPILLVLIIFNLVRRKLLKVSTT